MTHGWTKSPQALLDRIWSEVGDLATPRGGHAGLATLATIGADGGPELRQVVLRRADRAAGRIEVFTDAATPKVAEVRANRLVSLLLWHPADQLQIRLRGEAEVIGCEAALPDWQAMSEAQRGNYGTVPPPGTPIDASRAFCRVPDPARLAILRIMLSGIDAVHLARPVDCRAVYARSDDWRGQWVAP